MGFCNFLKNCKTFVQQKSKNTSPNRDAHFDMTFVAFKSKLCNELDARKYDRNGIKRSVYAEKY